MPNRDFFKAKSCKIKGRIGLKVLFSVWPPTRASSLHSKLARKTGSWNRKRASWRRCRRQFRSSEELWQERAEISSHVLENTRDIHSGNQRGTACVRRWIGRWQSCKNHRVREKEEPHSVVQREPARMQDTKRCDGEEKATLFKLYAKDHP